MIAKSMMKNTYLPKISFLLQLGSEILGVLSSNDFIQILQMFGTETKLQGFVWSHWSITILIYLIPKLQYKTMIFGKWAFFIMLFANIFS